MSNHKSDESKELELQNYKNWSQQYAEDSSKIENLLKQVGFDKSDLLLSSKCNDMFNALISVSQRLKLNDFDVDRSVYDLITEKLEMDSEACSHEIEKNRLDEKLRKVHTLHENLTKENASLKERLPSEKNELQEKEASIQFKQIKLEKYKSQVNEAETYLNSIDKRLQHENIVDQYKSLEAFQKSIEEAKVKLEQYQHLPANIASANRKLDSFKAQINKLDQEIEIRFGLTD